MKKMASPPKLSGCYDIPNETAVPVQPRPPAEYPDVLNAAIAKLHPECSIGDRCLINQDRDSWLLAVTEQIRTDNPGFCAGVQTDSEGLVDQLCFGTRVPGTDRSDRCQGNHSYTCRVGCKTGVVGWAPGSYVNRDGDTWVRP
jgi:hypothetical protein